MRQITYGAATLLLAVGICTGQANQRSSAQSTAQQPVKRFTPGSVLPAELSKTLNAKKAKTGDPVQAKVPTDLMANGQIVVPRDSKIIGHVVEAKPSEHGSDSLLGIAFDKVVLTGGTEVPMDATIQAIAAPAQTAAQASVSGQGSPAPAPSAGNPGMSGGSSGSAGMGSPQQPTGPTLPSEYPTSNNNGHAVVSAPLTAQSQGVIGLPKLSLGMGASQESAITSQGHNVKLDSGTQLLLRVK